MDIELPQKHTTLARLRFATLNTTTALIISMLELSVGKSYPRRWELKIPNEPGNGRPQFTCRLSTAMVVLMHVFLCYPQISSVKSLSFPEVLHKGKCVRCLEKSVIVLYMSLYTKGSYTRQFLAFFYF